METITFKKRITSALLAMAIMMSMLSIEILAAIPVHAEPSAINVKVRVNTENNKPAKAYDVTVDGSESELIYFEDNEDEISAVDVLVAVHKKEFGTSFDGNEIDYVYVDSEFGAVNPFWGSYIEAIKTYKNNKEVGKLMEEAASEGDEFAFAKVLDTDMYTDKYIYFDGDVKTETNGDISVKVKSFSVEYDNKSDEKDEVLEGAEIEFKSDKETLTAKTDANGIAKVKSTKPGTFEVSVKSTPYDYAYFPPVETVKAGPKETTPEQEVKDGQNATVNGYGYKVLSAKVGTAAFTKAANKKSVTVPDTVKINGRTLKVTQINAGAFNGKKIKTVTVGKNVNKIAKNAFKGSKATKMIVKTKNLKKASVKGSLKGSKLKTVQVKIGKKKVNKKYVKKYKKIFTKKNAGKRVKIR